MGQESAQKVSLYHLNGPKVFLFQQFVAVEKIDANLKSNFQTSLSLSNFLIQMMLSILTDFNKLNLVYSSLSAPIFTTAQAASKIYAPF